MATDAAALTPPPAAPKAPQRDAGPRVGDPRLRQIRNFISQTEAQPFDIVKAIKSGLRGRMLLAVMVGAFLGACLAVTIKSTVKPLYMSQGVLRLSARDQSILYNSLDDSRLRLFDAFTMGETNFITSRQVLDRALTIAKQKGIPNLPADGAGIEGMLEVKGIKGLLTVNATSRNPETAAGVLNAVLDGYNQAHVDQYDERQDFRERELVARDKELLTKLAKMDAEILEIGGEYGAGSIAKAHNEKLGQVQEISTRIAELEAQIAGVDSRDPKAGAAKLDGEIAKQIASDSAIGFLVFERMKKVAEMKVLSQRYAPQTKRMMAVQTEIDTIDIALAERQAKIESLADVNSGDEELKVDGKSPEEMKDYLERLKERRAVYATEAKDLNNRSVNLTFLEEERKQTRELLDESRKVLEQVRLERRNMSLGPAEIVERGAIPTNPYQDKSKQLMGVGFFGGFGLSFVLFIIYGIMRPRIRHEDDVKAIGKGVALAGVLSPDGATGVHKLRNTLQLALGEPTGTGRSLAVMSLHPGAGAGMVAKALGLSFADSGAQTMVIDADLKTPSLTFSFGHAELTGLREFIAGNETGIGTVRSGTIDVLPTGRGAIDDDSLSLAHVRKLIVTASESHELVIVDCGEVEARLAASLFAAEADLVVGVVRQDATDGEVRLAVSRLNAITQRPVQVVYVTDPNYKRKPATPLFVRAATGKLLAALKPHAATLVGKLKTLRKEKK